MIEMTTVDKEGRAKIEPVILVPKDYVQIVRCKDCKHFEEDLYKGLFEGDGVCFHEHWVLEDTGFEVKETDYCSYGERKDE